MRTGDGSWTDENLLFIDQKVNNNEMIEDMDNKEPVWGWGDEAMTEKEKASINRRAKG